MHYLPLTPQDEKDILKRIGVSSYQELLDSIIPDPIQYKGKVGLPPALSEIEIRSVLKELTGENRNTDDFVSFLGAGVYDHYIPAIINAITSRSEFYTAYTPYQAEVSQGTLQTIFEYQSMICELTGMDAANASMYDGGSALAEACHMANSIRGKNRIVMADSIHPFYQRTVRTYTQECCIEIITCPAQNGVLDLDALEKLMKDEASCMAVQHPNFFGNLENMREIEQIVHRNGALFVSVIDPLSLGVIAPPSEYRADIAVGEGQAMGIAQGFGGPLLGVFATRMEHVRYMPGRVAGQTTDVDGKRGFVLTLQTREQHIRREKATSNICTNEALCALSALIYLCALGRQGIVDVGNLCFSKSHYLFSRLRGLKGIKPAFEGREFFKEFTLETTMAARAIVDRLLEHKIFGGVPLSIFGNDRHENHLLVAVTEKRSKQELDQFVDIISSLV
jgi:glycine dehydrogenase subunit 1